MFQPAMSFTWTYGARLPCFAILLLLLCGIRGCWSINSEGLALLHFLAKVESDPSGGLGNWDPTDHTPCMWRGVYCLDGNVHVLDLRGLGIVGLLAPEIGNLSHLRVLDLSKNQFSGTIPQEFGHLKTLEILDLRDNNLTGRVPADLGQLQSLKIMLLGNNRFDGGIPPEIENLTSQTNQLVGDSPTNVALVVGYLNRKFGIRLSALQQPQRSNSFMVATKGFIIRSLELFHLFKYQTEMPHDHAYHSQTKFPPDDSDINPTDSGFNVVRRRLAEEPSNLVAIPPKVLPPDQPGPVLTLPSRSSGSFPAIQKTPSPVPSQDSDPASTPAPAPAPTLGENHTPATPSPSAASQSTVEQSSEAKRSENSLKSMMWIWLIVFLFILAIAVFIICRSRAVKKLSPWKSGLSGQLQKAFITGVPKLNREELETACEDFSNIINTNEGVATVYKGTLSSGVEIAVVSTAVSSLKDWSKRSDLIFRKKIDSLSKVNHKNFLNLIGYCEENQPFTRMMVFEYAPSGSLSEHLHGEDLEHLDWNARMRIVMGTAYCLQHMHDLNPPIPHFNLTSKDILLTDDYAAKVSDNGFWAELVDKLKKPSENELDHSELHSASDLRTNVGSFGIMLLEIISGRHPYTQEQGHITNWAAPHLNDEEKMKNLVDPKLKSCNEKELQVVCEVIKRCIEEDERKRPSMREVVEKLTEVIKVSPNAATPKLSPLWWAELEILSAEAP